MCKIVPRYALHHRVASSPPALFLPLTFFRSLLSPLRASIFRASSIECFFWLLSILAALLAFFPLLFSSPLDLSRVFPPVHLVPFLLRLFFLAFLIFLHLFSLRSYFSLIFLRISGQLIFTSSSSCIYVFAIFFRFLSSFCLSVTVFLEGIPLYVPLFWCTQRHALTRLLKCGWSDRARCLSSFHVHRRKSSSVKAAGSIDRPGDRR